MSFFSPIAGLRPADSITISLAAAIGVAAIYAQKVGPVSDVHQTMPGDGSINSGIKKAGWQALLLVAAVTLLSRDLNVTILGGGAIIYEHIAYLHADMASPADGQIAVAPQSYQPAGSGSVGLAVAAG